MLDINNKYLKNGLNLQYVLGPRVLMSGMIDNDIFLRIIFGSQRGLNFSHNLRHPVAVRT